MSEERPVKEVFLNTPEGKRSVEKPRKRWLDDVENDLRKWVLRGRRKTGEGSDARKLILQEGRVLQE
jgi:hypothetical protein